MTPTWEQKQRSGIRAEDRGLLSPIEYVVSDKDARVKRSAAYPQHCGVCLVNAVERRNDC